MEVDILYTSLKYYVNNNKVSDYTVTTTSQNSSLLQGYGEKHIISFNTILIVLNQILKLDSLGLHK